MQFWINYVRARTRSFVVSPAKRSGCNQVITPVKMNSISLYSAPLNANDTFRVTISTRPSTARSRGHVHVLFPVGAAADDAIRRRLRHTQTASCDVCCSARDNTASCCIACPSRSFRPTDRRPPHGPTSRRRPSSDRERDRRPHGSRISKQGQPRLIALDGPMDAEDGWAMDGTDATAARVTAQRSALSQPNGGRSNGRPGERGRAA